MVIGGGAAGVAAAKRLTSLSIRCLLVEARPRLGGRAWTVHDGDGHALDLGCGWLHSADRNPWTGVAQQHGLCDRRDAAAMDESGRLRQACRARTTVRFARPSTIFTRVSKKRRNATQTPRLRPCSIRRTAGNSLLDAMSTYISGAELARVSLKDLDNYRQHPHQLARGRRLRHAHRRLWRERCRPCSTVRSAVSITAASA